MNQSTEKSKEKIGLGAKIKSFFNRKSMCHFCKRERKKECIRTDWLDRNICKDRNKPDGKCKKIESQNFHKNKKK